MSNGHPCSRITGWPSAGPSSAYPMLRTPALTCLRDANDVFFGLAGVRAIDCGFPPFAESEAPFGCALPGLNMPSSAAAIVIAALPKKLRRLKLELLCIVCSFWNPITIGVYKRLRALPPVIPARSSYRLFRSVEHIQHRLAMDSAP